MNDVEKDDLPLPGTLLAGRYRIVAPLGRGGMGEVFRVYDLKLDQEVALKHLSPRLAGAPAALARFHREVRLARQVTHPNVCRVFDIGDSGGQPFLTMELIDGEDLASLLLRIGRLLPAKGLEIAQQLCAGLAAIHDSGVLHRDLKPSNIMIDGRGHARITDFGISALSSEPVARSRVGTPAYMAPEQRSGGGATVRSDLYSLGLVLYELLTGQPAGALPVPPSELCPEIDPQIDQVLLRCRDPDPYARPASARQLAALLPGLDPLTAAVAAGETPSPALVAAAARGGSLRPTVGLACLAGVILSCAGIIALSPQARLLSLVPLPRSPEVLADRAEAMLPSLGVVELPAEVRFGLDDNSAYLNRLAASGRSTEIPSRFAARHCPAALFWYRRSPRPLVPTGPRVTRDDPASRTPGEISLQLDPDGRLYRFERMPPDFLPAGPSRPPDWTALFAAAGLDPKRFSPAMPEWAPPVYVDTRAAWEGSWTEPPHPPIPVRIEAGALHGTPIYFRLSEPWEPGGPPAVGRRYQVENAVYNGFFVVVAVFALLLAARNVRLGRADTRWALWLSGFVFGACLLTAALSAAPFAAAFWQRALGDALRQAGMIGLCYLSLEPALRRHRPERIVSWSRLLSGRLRDPLVGRDVLVGTLLGSAMGLVLFVTIALVRRSGDHNSWHLLRLERLQGASGFLGGLLGDLMISLLTTLGFLLFLTALRPVLRRESLALTVCWALATAVLMLRFGDSLLTLSLPLIGLGCALFVLSWARFGLLAGVVHYLTLLLALDYPMTGEVSVWYSWLGTFALVSILGLATYGCLVAVAGQPWWRGALLED